MQKMYKISILCLILLFITSCTTIRQLKSYRKGNDFYIENIDSEGNIIGNENIIINNITFFSINYIILGITENNTTPKQLWSGTIAMRSKDTLNVRRELFKTGESLNNYKYLYVHFPEGTLKKCSSYCEDDDIYIEIEQYGIEPNVNLNQINEELLQELEIIFNQ